MLTLQFPRSIPNEMKALLKFLAFCLLVLCVSCGKIEDKQVTISYGPAKKPVRLGDYYWTQVLDGDTIAALDSKMVPVGTISKQENPRDYQTVVGFIKSSSRGSAQ